MWWPFRRKEKIDPDSIASERWQCAFSWFQRNRFAIEETHTYSSEVRDKSLVLTVKRKNQFCWVPDTLYRYADFALEGLFSFGRENGYSSLGFILRAASEDSYYYLLVSNRGYFRFDVVFNGNPRPLIDWTKLSSPLEEDILLRAIAHGSHFSFFIGADFIGEIEDETLDAGGLAFAAQNYDEKDEAQFRLKAVLLESRPIEVEAWYYRWNDYVAADPDARITLAGTFFSMGQYQAAVIQIKKSFRDRKPGIREFFLLAECFIHLGLYAESLAAVEKVLSLDQEHGDALREKANLLYLQNRFLEARDFTEGLIDKGLGGSFLYNLLGNAEYGLGNWEKAAFAYRNALRAEPAMPLFAMNAGRAFEMAGMREEALASYVDAAKEFFRQEAFEDISLACERIRSIDRNNADARIIEAKLLFNSQRYEEAGKLLRSVRGAGDSSVPFLLGILESMAGNREEALGFFNEAAALEPDFPLYRFKLAENLYLSGREAGEQIEKALSLAPDDVWTLNLAGQYFLDRGDLPRALSLLKEAHEKAPSEADIRINYSEVLARLSQYSSALALLDGAEPDARVYNQKGNLLSSSGDTEKALEAHQAALRLDPENPVILENCAASALAADRIALAEELLVRLLDSAPSERAFRMMGDTARALGEYRRAEAAYREALKLAPADQPALICLAELYLSTGRYAEAAEAARSVKDPEYKHRSERVLSQVKRATETRYACASCGREWWVPKNIPSQGTVRLIGEPEDESPAGMCPLCGKVYCVSCAKGTLKDNRFICPDCGEYLKLQDDGLKFLAAGYAAGAHRAP